MNKAKQGAMNVAFFQQESYQRTKNPSAIKPTKKQSEKPSGTIKTVKQDAISVAFF